MGVKSAELADDIGTDGIIAGQRFRQDLTVERAAAFNKDRKQVHP
ncbi:hypothetical protein [Brenneria izadpanahii]|nr:hypothetical protein [Brenneria izadpanahii]